MNLFSGRIPWEHTLPVIPSYPQPEGDLHCDCLIVGAGMSGAMMAYRLAESGAHTVVIEKRKVAGGSSQANTGLLQVANDKSLTACINTFGKDKGVLFYRLCQSSIKGILELQDKLNINPYITARPSLLYASTAEDVKLLRQEHENLVAHGFDSEFWEESDIAGRYSFSKPGGLYSRGDAEANPFRMVHALLDKAHASGVRIYEHTEARRLEYGDAGVVCHTEHGRIYARKVVFSMGYETQEMKKDRGAELVNTYAIMTRPLRIEPKWHERSLIWETARPYLYLRMTHDGRIIAGGKDETLTDPQRREVRVLSQSKRLLEEVEALFPELQGIVEAEYAWGAVFGTTRDGLPFIGPHPDYPNCYFIEGYGGNGTVYSMIAAELLADTLTGMNRPELELFSLTRPAKPSPQTV
ncbi:NAD(P)/FAD-dependent oxidoreductase [Paenibacillus tepidiphilus]|uniref:NAD(P)/FAD-dependent oxidoreductase n=1 Tax=Paenibacillus tepidiphilus TaxID=2608683 RepID=UPI0012391FBD|nr:FAD-dependent oxidoreductase [Paenibacillus tepidiphilus]